MSAEASSQSHARAMDRMYRLQRHIYDATRKYYLLGRDHLIEDLQLADGDAVLEVGCGTGRNLVAVGARYAQAKLYGFDISDEMLKSATASVSRAGMEHRSTFTQGDATSFPGRAAFGETGEAGFERVFISYSLSMIPDWQAALRQGLALTKPGGRFAVVDFGPCDRLPGLFKSGLYAWLASFDVTPRPDLEAVAREAADDVGGTMTWTPLYRGYAVYLRIDR